MEDSVKNSKQSFDGMRNAYPSEPYSPVIVKKPKLSKLTILERVLLIPIGIVAYIIGAITSTIKNYYEDGYDNHDD